MALSIPLTRDQVAQVDEEDADLLEFNWRATLNRGKWYARRWSQPFETRKIIYLHREVAARAGWDIAGKVVDHKDGNGLNNRRDNLRVATNAQNSYNSGIRASNTSGFKGVHFNKSLGKYVAVIRAGGRRFTLGKYDSAEDAGRVYADAARKYHGEFANAPMSLADATPEPAKCGMPLLNGHRCALNAGHYNACPMWRTEVASSPPAQGAPKQWKEHARCGFPIVSSNREAAVTAVGKHQATCDKCNAQEAPKAAPVPSCMWKHATTPCAGPIAIRYVGQAGKREPHGWCEGHMLEYERQAAARPEAGKPYAGPERLPRPQLAADWVEDCLPTVWR